MDNSRFEWSDERITKSDPVRTLLAKYPVHTFGISKAHDPHALFFVAKESEGTFHSITEDLSSRIMEALAICLAGLKNITIIDARVEIKSIDPTWPTKITRIDCGGYKSHISKDGTSGTIWIGSLYDDEDKHFMVYFEFTVPRLDAGEVKIRGDLLVAETKYKTLPEQSIHTETSKLIVFLLATQDKAFLHGKLESKREVLQQIIRFKVLDMLESFQEEFRALKKKAGKAVEREKGEDTVLQTIAAKTLQDKWREFQTSSDTTWTEAVCRGAAGNISRDMRAMVQSLKQGLGAGCIYSWVSSYQMQRPTTTCLPPADAVKPVFYTSDVQQMVEEAQEQSEKDAAQLVEQETRVAAAKKEKDTAAASSKCKCAMELLDAIEQRLELWSKLERPPTSSQPPKEGAESSSLAATMHQDVYQVRNVVVCI